MRKRFLLFAIAVFILIPLLPIPSQGVALTKEINVFLNDFKLKVEGKSFSHKEAFLYQGDIYVPMKDLGKALGMGINFDGSRRTLTLNSNGRLRFDDSSKYPIAYQRGYEIEAKERLMDSLNKDIRVFLDAAGGKSNSSRPELNSIRVGFSNTRLYLDGREINLDGEVFLYNNDIYLSLTSLSPYLYITPRLNNNIIDIDCNGVLKDKARDGIYPGYYSIDELVKFREDLNNRYARELAELNKKKKIIMDVKIPYEEVKSLRDMEIYLNKHLGKIKDLNIDIGLASAADRMYYLDISFPRNQDYRWRKLSRRDVESHIWDIYVAISSLYDEDSKIQGAIRNPSYSSNSASSRRNYVSFDTVYRGIEFDFYNSNLQDRKGKIDPIYIERLLAGSLASFARIGFDYSPRISGYDLELLIDASSSRIRDWSPSLLHSYLHELNLLINREYPELRVFGKIRWGGDDSIDFSLIDGMIGSSSLNLSIEEELNNKYGQFIQPSLRATIKYSLVDMGDRQFKLVANIDYDTLANSWSGANLEALNAYIQSSASYVLNLIDGDLFIQIFDKNQLLLNEYSIFRNTVAMVVADPSPGEVVEGTKVRLSTDTSDAVIYYSLDGSTPSKNSLVYREPIEIYGERVIKTFAAKAGLKESNMATFIYTTKDDPNMAGRLKGLSVENLTLNPPYSESSLNQDFSVNLPHSMPSITIRAFGDGIVLIDDVETVNDRLTLDVDVGTRIVKIVHREEGKTDRIYNLKITRGEQDYPDLMVDVQLFNVSVSGAIKGSLSGGGDSDYRDYEFVLMLRDSKDTVIKRIPVNSNGSFEDTFGVELIHKLIGYKYEVYKGAHKVAGPTNIDSTP